MCIFSKVTVFFSLNGLVVQYCTLLDTRGNYSFGACTRGFSGFKLDRPDFRDFKDRKYFEKKSMVLDWVLRDLGRVSRISAISSMSGRISGILRIESILKKNSTFLDWVKRFRSGFKDFSDFKSFHGF